MDKVIKEFNINNYTYQLGYILYDNKVYPRINIYKNNKLLSGGFCHYGACAGSFGFIAYYSSSAARGNINTIKEMFIKLRKYNEIPEIIETEYENMFLLYKLNNFNKI